MQSRNLALAEVELSAFCRDDKGLVYLSPFNQVAEDPDNSRLHANIGEISTLQLFSNNIRVKHAFSNAKNIEDLLKHPATWSHAQDSNLLFDLITYTDRKCLNSLNQKIKTKTNAGRRNWAIHPAILRDFKTPESSSYDTSSVWDLARFIRNKTTHFHYNNQLNEIFSTPETIIPWFNKHVVSGGGIWCL